MNSRENKMVPGIRELYDELNSGFVRNYAGNNYILDNELVECEYLFIVVFAILWYITSSYFV